MQENSISEYANAGLMRRLAALFYDGLLIIALWMMLGGLLVFINQNEVIEVPILPIILPLVIFGFYCKFWLGNGQTLGMQTWRMKIISRDGNPINFKQCVQRFAFATLSWLCLGLGYWWMLIDRDKLTWHDRYSNTRLVVLPKP